MKIIFSEEGCGYVLVFNTDWTFAKKILEICWNEITIESFHKNIERDEERKKSVKPKKKV